MLSWRSTSKRRAVKIASSHSLAKTQICITTTTSADNISFRCATTVILILVLKPKSVKVQKLRRCPPVTITATVMAMAMAAAAITSCRLCSTTCLLTTDTSCCSFYARQHICYSAYMPWQFRLSDCPSVCLSVTRVDQSKTVEARITQFSL